MSRHQVSGVVNLNNPFYLSGPHENKGLPHLESTTEDKRAESGAIGEPVAAPRSSERPRLDLGSDVEIAHLIEWQLKRDFRSVPFCEGEFWRYSGPHWEPIPRDELRRRVHEFDGLPWGDNRRSG
jgi:hypothetical protein